MGWVGLGLITDSSSSNSLALTTISLNDQLERFWKIEEFNNKNQLYTDDEVKCEKIFTKTTIRDDTDRFIVFIPLGQNINLGNSKSSAIKRFSSLERRLQKQPAVKQMYGGFIQEYERLGHMTKTSSAHTSTQVEYFLPHHHVLRVVFDGSCKSESGKSLNDCQFTGPTIQNDLFGILLSFRKHTYIATADIKQMYRQIIVNKEQRQLQQIVWRNDPRDSLSTYEINTVTYGTTSAPYWLSDVCMSWRTKII